MKTFLTERSRLVILAALVICAFSAKSSNAADIAFQKIAPDVYAFIGEIEGRTYNNEALNANIGLILTPIGNILVDSGASRFSAQKISAAARKLNAQEIRWVINTGSQDHRWLGNSYFKANGAQIIAHAMAQADMKARGADMLSVLGPVLKDKLAGTEISLPTQWLAQPDTAIDLGGVRLELFHRGGAHTPADLLVWLPAQRLMFSGDVVYTDRMLGVLPVSNTKAWLETFAVIDRIKPDVIVPGHGSVSTLAKAQAETRDLLLALRHHAGKAVEQGIDISAAVKSFDNSRFKHLLHADVWTAQNANRVYLEVERE